MQLLRLDLHFGALLDAFERLALHDEMRDFDPPAVPDAAEEGVLVIAAPTNQQARPAPCCPQHECPTHPRKAVCKRLLPGSRRAEHQDLLGLDFCHFEREIHRIVLTYQPVSY